MNYKRGQVWIETVIYTLIGLALIGIVLGIAMPKINASRDRALVEQSVNTLNTIDGKMGELLDKGSGNVRRVSALSLRKGELTINSPEDTISIYLDGLGAPYSQPGLPLSLGRVTVLTEELNKGYSTTLTLNYTLAANLTYDGKDVEKKFTAASRPYAFTMHNKGAQSNDDGTIRFEIDFVESSGG